MRRWIGFLGSWALLVLALGLAAIAAAGEWINLRDSRRLERVEMIDRLIAERGGTKAEKLRIVANGRAAEINRMQQKVDNVSHETNDMPDTGQVIVVSTTENHLYVRDHGQVVFDAVCSTGKGTTLAVDGKTLVFDTPIGKLHIKSKEVDPVWVPPDWHFVEEARKSGMRVVHLNRGGAVDADTGDPVSGRSEGVWSWFSGSRRTLRVQGNTVVEEAGGSNRELPPGKLIVAGNTIVVPPVDTAQRRYAGVLGKYRLELGDGYGIHGTDQPQQLGQSVSHGCVRLGDADIERLYQIANVGDEVIIY
jgi:lipoprotein-anchoring transpeptidase ErfK/SrfK